MKKRRFVFAAMFILVIFFSATHNVQGTSWSNEKRLTTWSNVDSAPSIIQTQDRRIWVIWEKEVMSYRALFYRTSSDYGFSWSLEENLTNVPSVGMNQDPAIVQLSNGTIMVFFSSLRSAPVEPDFTLGADPSALSVQKGTSGNTNIIVTSLGGYSAPVNLNCKSVIPPSPYIHASFDPNPVTPPPNSNANSTMTITVESGAVAQSYTLIVNGYSPSLNKTKSVNVYLTVTSGSGSASSCATPVTVHAPPDQDEMNYDVYYKASHDNGASWSEAVKLTQDPNKDLSPYVMQASNGTIWLVWSSKRTGNFDLYYKTSSNMGASWSDDTQLTTDVNVDSAPALTQTSDGKIWVVWHSDRNYNNGGLEIFCKTYDGAQWSIERRLTNTAKDIDDTCPSIVQTAEGTIWIFWASEGLQQPPYLLYKQSFDNGNTFGSTLQFTTGLWTESWPASIQTCDGRIWVVWASYRNDLAGFNFDIFYKNSLVHNVAVTEVTPAQTRVYQKENVSIEVEVRNFGDYYETFSVSCRANSTTIDTQSVNLNSGASADLEFVWNTSGFARGNYTITAEASTVVGELYTADNALTHETVEVKLLGDTDGNGVVNVHDLFGLGGAFGSSQGDPNWNEEADMNGDVVVNDIDLSAIREKYGESE